MSYFEELPDQCPPADATSLNGVFYRLVNKNNIVCDDFWSHRKIYPHKIFNVDECRVRSVSIFDNGDDCMKLTKLSLHKEKKVAEVTLNNTSGVAKRTGNEKSHYSWWRSTNFNHIEQSRLA